MSKARQLLDAENPKGFFRKASAVQRTIKAQFVPDNRDYSPVTFDAVPWFQEVSMDRIVELAKAQWCRDYIADQVAWTCEDHDPELKAAFQDVRAARSGFEVFVDEKEAARWLEQRRPDVYRQCIDLF